MSNKKSFIAKIEENILRLTKPKYMDSKEEINSFLKEKYNASNNDVKSI